MKNIAIETITWIATFMIVGSYGALSANWFLSSSLSYQIPNFVGAAIMSIYTWKRKVYQACFINSVWTIIAAFAILKIVQS